MNARLDIDRLIATWLEDGPTDIPDRVLDSALDDARARRQRPDRLGPLRRWIPMSAHVHPARTLALLVILALLVVVAVAAVGLIGGRPSRSPLLPYVPAKNGLIAFDADGDISVVNGDGSGRRALSSGPEVDTSPVWSADGRHIAFWSQRSPSTARDLVVIDADGTHRRVLAPSAGAAGTDGARARVSWSPDSSRLAYESTDSRVHVVGVDGSGDGSICPAGLLCDQPAWSPDGTQIVYRGMTNSDGTGMALHLVHPDGSGDLRLPTPPGGGMAFSGAEWSPDATQIAYFFGLDGTHDIGLIRVGSHATTVLSSAREDEYWPTWSPDGTWIVYQRNMASDPSQNAEIRVHPDGTGEQQIRLGFAEASNETLGGSPVEISPDGTLGVGYLAPPGDPANVWLAIFRVDGSGTAVLVPDHGNLGDGSWQRGAP